MASPWDRLGQAASVLQVTGVDALGLVSMIVQAAQIARRNRDLCLQLAQHVKIVGGLLGELRIPELRRRQVTRRTLDQLNDVLLRAYRLVRFCSQQQKTRSQLYQMITGNDVAAKLRQAQEEIDRYITLVPVIATVAIFGGQDSPREEAQVDDATNHPTPAAERPSLSLQQVTELLALEEPIGTVAVQIQEVTQLPTTVLHDIVAVAPEERRQLSDHPSSSAKEFTFNQLSSATRGFSPEFKISDNHFSTWYWGKLGDGREVAIKRFQFGPRGRRFSNEYRSELSFISSLQHRHLAQLVGYCMAAEREERLLVYDYMKNASLYGQLRADESLVVSSWKVRIKILLDASRGIDHLHSCAHVHGNITSANVLLDSVWTARVSDFVSSLMEPEVENMRAKVCLDPEHDVLQRLTVKSDVYSFGVVMLKVLTGKPTIIQEAEGGRRVSLANYAVPKIAAGELREVLDQRPLELAANEAPAVELAASTAVLCVQPEGKDRPVMAEVVARLETAVAIFEGGVPAQLSLPPIVQDDS